MSDQRPVSLEYGGEHMGRLDSNAPAEDPGDESRKGCDRRRFGLDAVDRGVEFGGRSRDSIGERK